MFQEKIKEIKKELRKRKTDLGFLSVSMRLFFIGFIVILSLAFSACKNDKEISHADFIDLGHDGFIPEKEYLFYPFENFSDSLPLSQTFNLYVCLRYTDKCRLNYLPLHIESTSLESDSIIEKVIDLQLFENNRVLGKGHYGIYEINCPFLEKIRSQKGFTVSIMTRQKDTQGILALGIITKEI